jgi:NADH dehydrogenase/NADH:ubiquinone oxidoreductase subunit G
MISLKIDGKEVQVAEGTSILEAAKSVGVNIPTLCYHKAVTPYGACRICTVEVHSKGRQRLVASCSYKVEPGIEVVTDSQALRDGRRMILELLLAQCPAAGSIREMAEEYGLKSTRFAVKDEKEDCTLCGLCTRVCDEMVKASAIGFEGRGMQKKVTTPFSKFSEECRACGACYYICPTGSIKMEQQIIDRLMKLDTPERPCRYMLMGIVPYKICPNEYRCNLCEVDQEYEDLYGTHPIIGFRAEEKEKQQ